MDGWVDGRVDKWNWWVSERVSGWLGTYVCLHEWMQCILAQAVGSSSFSKQCVDGAQLLELSGDPVAFQDGDLFMAATYLA